MQDLLHKWMFLVNHERVIELACGKSGGCMIKPKIYQ